MKRILSPSILAADFTQLGNQIKTLCESGIDHIHFDVMDGDFVPNISFGMPVLASLHKSFPDMIYDVHMMVSDPDRYVEVMKESGADIVTVHAEACIHLDRTVRHIRSLGMKAGIALNPATPISMLTDILSEADMILLMTVNPGLGGQSFIPYMLKKIRRLRDYDEKISIQVDGGIYPENLREILLAGADNIVAGSSVFNGNIKKNVDTFFDIFRHGDNE